MFFFVILIFVGKKKKRVKTSFWLFYEKKLAFGYTCGNILIDFPSFIFVLKLNTFYILIFRFSKHQKSNIPCCFYLFSLFYEITLIGNNAVASICLQVSTVYCNRVQQWPRPEAEEAQASGLHFLKKYSGQLFTKIFSQSSGKHSYFGTQGDEFDLQQCYFLHTYTF